jgi:amino acid adenylation domain-containing protein
MKSNDNITEGEGMGVDLKNSETFWREWWQNAMMPTSLGIAKPYSQDRSHQSEWKTRSHPLSSALKISLENLAQTCSIEVSTLFGVAWTLLLHRYSSEDMVQFGIAQPQPIPWQVQIPAEASLHSWINQFHEQLTLSQVHSDLSLIQIRELSQLTPGIPLFESLLILSEAPVENSRLQAAASVSLCDLIGTAITAENFEWQIDYNSRRFDDGAIDRLLGHLQTLLEGMVAMPDRPLAELPILTPSERHQLLVEWSNTEVVYPQDKCVHQIFEEQVIRSPESIAVTFGEQSLTYQQLNQQSNQVAHYLQTLGVGADSLVGLCVDRSLEMVIGILAILKAGAAYVPLDPTYPSERIAYVLGDASISVLLTQTHLRENLPACTVVDLTGSEEIAEQSQDNPNCKVTPDHLAYVIYTSGSTGNPKGVLVTHANVVRLFSATAAWYNFNAQDVWTLFHSYAFDFSVWELWGALFYGGRVVVVPYHISRDPHEFYHLLSREQVTVLNQTPSAFRQLIHAEAGIEPPQPLNLRFVIFGGEALELQSLKPWFDRHGDRQPQLVNMYGITETTVHVTYRPIALKDLGGSASVIGYPIPDLQIYLFDRYQQPVPIGVAGEIYVGGKGVTRGYLNRPQLTAERFLPNSFTASPDDRLYKTGDLARYQANGELEYLGRIDHQVKIRGFRIELGEIKAALAQHPAVRENVVIVREDNGGKRLVAYLVPYPGQHSTVSDLQQFLQRTLPEYMVPAVFMWIEALPLTVNGKVDQRRLPAPGRTRPQLAQILVLPQTPIEQQLADLWGKILDLEQIGIDDNFFELGGTSLLGAQVLEQIEQQMGVVVRAVKLYQYPTVHALAQYLTQEKNQPHLRRNGRLPQQSTLISPGVATAPDNETSKGIAIVGMVGRFPGANSVEELWHNLCNSVEAITFFTDAELDPSESLELRQDPNYVPTRGVLQGAETFDAAFFGINPREAEVMDPQSRVFLELVYEALENAAYMPEFWNGAIGLYAGSGQNTYFERHLCGRPEIIDRLGAFQTMLANEKDFLTTRAAYKLNLTGPSVSINTACSTSLVAVIQAVQGLNQYQCDIALAGGVSITTPQNTGYLYQEGGMLSPDGKCRPFDANAQGTMFNNGAGIVVLKRLADAQRDGDRIYAVIKGVGINNDGSDKVSFTAPSVNGQIGAILKAQADAGFHPETISYIEAHGTATPLGDPIEIEALTQAFRTQTESKQFCAIGSIKSNIGHVVAAAGVAGLIKTALALYHQQLPASLNFEAPNPEINFEDSPFYVNHQLTDWKTNHTVRRAGVSSFGVGGTNAHVVLEETPVLESIDSTRPCQLLLLSAKTDTALNQMTENLKNHLQKHSEANLADVAYTLQQGRRAFNQRRFVVCRNGIEAIDFLTTLPPQSTNTRSTNLKNPDVVFMFPGQGSQYINMGLSFYQREPVFQGAIDRCARILKPLLDQDLREVLYPADATEDAATLLRQTIYTQPALFAVEYALAMLWQSWGIQPAAMIGHSIGEFVAACVARVFSLEDALMLVATRGRMMWELPSGAMLSVRLPAAEVEKRLTAEMAIAAINGPSLCVVSGPTNQIADLQQTLEVAEVVCKPLHTSHAFHSPMMNPIIEPFTELIRKIQLFPPQIPFVSTVTADWITNDQATDPAYWANHLRATVHFAKGVQTLWQQPQRVLLEVGPRTTAATLARQQAKNLSQQIAISSLGSTSEDDAEWTAILQAIGQLWLSGVSIDWQSFYANERRSRLPLPTYPFERQRYWIDPEPAVAVNQMESASVAFSDGIQSPTLPQQPLLQQHLSQPEEQSFSMPDSRKQRLISLLKEVLETTSGLDVASASEELTFLEMGLDSLSLTQVALALKKQFKVKITFRNLLEDYLNLDTLATFLDQTLPVDALPAPVVVAVTASANEVSSVLSPPASSTMTTPHFGSEPVTNGSSNQTPTPPSTFNSTPGAIETLVAQQLQLMAQQLELLRQSGGTIRQIAQSSSLAPTLPPVSAVAAPTPTVAASTPIPTVATPTSDLAKPKKMHGPGAKIERSNNNTLTTEQRSHLDRLMARYIAQTQESKRQAQVHRRHLADPRTVSGFCPLLKEMVYPIVVDRSSGSKLWDVDGNEYVDLTNGFGLNFFGWNPDFVKAAVIAQLDKGIEIGPQTPLAGKVAQMITEFTGMERVAFCNTGSEAVMAALRLARTVTGRNTVAVFSGAYHGTFDEVIVRSGTNLRSLPAAPGIMSSMFENILVLDYGTPESLEILRNRADDLAAIMLEPVQSRHPGLQPKEFLHELRHLTQQSGTAFIVDEVVTGFRVHPGGAQAYFGVQADLASYGKVVGGGLPIGILAGKAEYMDALDGGFWQFGDDSIPEVGVTFFAGTFVRHPMALAAAEAVLMRLKQAGPELQSNLNAKVEQVVTYLKQHFARVGAPFQIEHFSSFFYITYPPETTYGSLLFYLLREKGVHIWENRPCFLTLAHSDSDIEFITHAFKDSVAELQAAGLLPGVSYEMVSSTNGRRNGKRMSDRNSSPHPGARIGRDPLGNPAWFIPDPERSGKYLQVGGVS